MNWILLLADLAYRLLIGFLDCVFCCRSALRRRFSVITCICEAVVIGLVCLYAGTLHVADEIREINGLSVHGQSVEKLQKMLVFDFACLLVIIL